VPEGYLKADPPRAWGDAARAGPTRRLHVELGNRYDVRLVYVAGGQELDFAYLIADGALCARVPWTGPDPTDPDGAFVDKTEDEWAVSRLLPPWQPGAEDEPS
jgi:hypothetical protein